MTGPRSSTPAWGQAWWQRAAPAVLGLLGGTLSLVCGIALIDGGETTDEIAGWLLVVGGVAMIVGGSLSTVALYRLHRTR